MAGPAPGPVLRLALGLERGTTALALAGAVLCLCVAAATAFWQVATRFALGQPSTWTEVVTRSAMIWCVFLGLAPTIRQGAIIAVDLLPRLLAGRARRALVLGGIGLSMLFFSILAWQGAAMTARVARQNLAALDVSIAWVYAALPAGSAFALVALLACALREIAGLPPPGPASAASVDP